MVRFAVLRPLLAKEILTVILLLALFPATANAQALYGQRLQGANGWLLPVASTLLGSDEHDHLNRGSVNAWDLSASIGSPAWAIGPGVVEYAGCNNAGGYGCWLLVNHGGGYSATYAHCAEGSIRARSGQQVDANTQICNVGMTGITSWPHMHLEITLNGQRLRIDKVFNRQQMNYCHFTKCKANNSPGAPVQGTIQAGGMAQQAVTVTSPGQRILQAVAVAAVGMGGQLVALLFVVILASLLAFWLANNAVRVVMVCVVVCGVVSVTVAILFVPAQRVSASQPATPGDFDIAYRIVRGEEGRGCDTYIVRTLNGVTQWTYDRYNRERGAPRVDVCQNLTEAEAKDIYYRYYWQPSGAGNLTMSAAIQAFDHAINAGVGEGKKVMAACGNDAVCIARQRIVFYQNTKTCQIGSSVCVAWLRRVENVYKRASGG